MSQKLATQIAELEQKLAFVSKTYLNYKKEHPNTKKRPSDFEHAMGKTQSGKKIMKHYDHPKHKSFGIKDHKDAWEQHALEKHRTEHKLRGMNNEHPNAAKLHKKVQFHGAQAEGHLNALEKMRSKRKKESALLEARIAAIDSFLKYKQKHPATKMTEADFNKEFPAHKQGTPDHHKKMEEYHAEKEYSYNDDRLPAHKHPVTGKQIPANEADTKADMHADLAEKHGLSYKD